MWFNSAQDPQINTSTRAQNLIDAAVSDTAQPATTQTVVGPYDWRFEIGDLLRWPADTTHYTSDLDLAVTALQHRLTPDECSTTYFCRGRPTGGDRRWRRLDIRRQTADTVTTIAPTAIPVGTVSAYFDDVGNLGGVCAGQSDVGSWKIVGEVGTAPPDLATVRAATPIDGATLDEAELDTATAGELGYVAAIPYTGAGGTGTEGPLLWSIARFGTTADGIPDGSVGTDQLSDGAATAAKQSRQSQMFATDVRFSTTTTTVSWNSGTLTLADGTAASINSGSATIPITGDELYVYYSGSTTLSTTESIATLLGDESHVLLATTQRYAGSTLDAFLVPAIGAMGKTGMKINADQIAANSITAGAIASISLTTLQAAVGTLSELNPDAGIIVNGELRNAAGTRFIDLDASGTDPFIKHDNFSLLADGTATFSGALSAATGTFAGSLSAASGTFAGSLSAASGTFAGTVSGSSFTATTATFDGAVNIKGSTSVSVVQVSAPGNAPTITFNPAAGGSEFGHLASDGSNMVLVGASGYGLKLDGAAGMGSSGRRQYPSRTCLAARPATPRSRR
jgi:hypothetical protein